MTSAEAATLYSELRTTYQDNRDWLSTRSVSKARLFQDACIGLIEARPTLAMHTAAGGQHQTMFDAKSLQTLLSYVTRWLEVNDSSVMSASPRAMQLVPCGVRD